MSPDRAQKNGAKAIETALPGVYVIEPAVHADARGFVLESYSRRVLRELTGIDADFVQDNHSMSFAGVLRGLHYQLRQPQGKLVRVIEGAAFDVAVDLRRSSRYFGHWTGVTLSAQNKRMLWIPPGFAHGVLATSAACEVLYKMTDYRVPECERRIRWDDPTLAIAWPLSAPPILSCEDEAAPRLAEAEVYS